MKKILGLATLSAGALVLSVISALPASAEGADPEQTSAVPTFETAAPPKGARAQSLPENAGGVPTEMYAKVAIAEQVLGEGFNVASWDASSEQLTLHVNDGATDSDRRVALTSLGDSVATAIVEDPFVRSELAAQAAALATEQPLAGVQVVAAGPNADASAIDVTVNSDGAQPSARRALPRTIEGVPLNVSYGEAPVATNREVDPYPPHFGGAKMSRPNGVPGKVQACTTGFGIGYMSGSTLKTELLTADHCGKTGTQWRTGLYTDSPVLGTMRDTSRLGADVKRLVGADFAGAIYSGANSTATWSPVSGAIAPILGDSWCMSGAPSGVVCSNKVTSMNQSICYPADALCYTGQVYTNQTQNKPAAGQGDSGGPVFATNKAGQPIGTYAAGIISGIFGNSTTCAAQQDGRLCSHQVIVAPVSDFFAANNAYGILVMN